MRLRHLHIEQLQPVLERLQGEAAEDQADAESAEAAFGEVVGVVLDQGIDGHSDAGDHPGYESHAQGEGPGMVDVVYEKTAEKS